MKIFKILVPDTRLHVAHLLVAGIILNFCYLITASVQIPTFQFELLSNHIIVSEYKTYQSVPISVSSPKQVNDEFIIFWRNDNQNHNKDLERSSALPTQLQIKLTCRASYWTEWKIISDVDENDAEQMDASNIRYSLRPLPRDNEDPMTSSGDKYVEREYSLTELTINSFGPKFKSGTIDCVHHNDSHVKSRLHIFQRFVDINVNPFRSSQGKTLNYKTTTAVPCTVHDPGKVPSFQYLNWYSKWTNVIKNFNYKWTIGFEPKENNVFQVNTKYRCAYFKNCFGFLGTKSLCVTHSVEYTIENTDTKKHEEHREKDISNIVRNKVFKSVSANGQETITFVCELSETEKTRSTKTKLTAIRISSCTSPQYCVSNSDQKSARNYFETIRCSDAQSTYCATFLTLPLQNSISESRVSFHGRVSCLGGVDKKSGISHDFYFTELSEHISLLSEFHGKPPLSEIFTLEISRQNLTFAKISCKSLKFFTFPSIKMYITFMDGSTEELGPTEGPSKIEETNHVYYREVFRPIRYSNIISHITCFVPPYGSPDWADVTEDWPPDLVENPVAVTDIPNSRNGKDNKFNGSKTVPPKTARPPSKHRNRYRGGSGFMPPKKQDQSSSKKGTVDQVENKPKIGGSSEKHGIGGSQIGGILAGGIILILIFVPCFVSRYYTVQCMWHPSIKKSSAKDERKMETKIVLPSRLKLSERNFSFDENQIISEGQFSFVYQGNPGKSKKDNLSFKVNKVAGDAEQIAALLNEVQILGNFKKQHENIASILGAHIGCKVGKVYIALDSENTTNFRSYMKNGNMVRQKMLKMDSQNRLKTFITWFQDIANGMVFLHEQNIIHGNLAAENILVSPNNNSNSSGENNQVKISGFSFSQQLQKGSKYFKTIRSWTSEWDTSGWRWMPMESLRYMEFSKESDIWSFGVLMWEMFSFCDIPYTTSGRIFEFSNEFIQKLEFGIRLSQPALTPNEIYKKMNDCWNRYGKDRPSSTELSRFFNDILNNAQLYDNYYVYVQNS